MNAWDCLAALAPEVCWTVMWRRLRPYVLGDLTAEIHQVRDSNGIARAVPVRVYRQRRRLS